MNPERWKKTEDIFQSALDLTGDEREELIRAQCGDDAELLAEVKKLIARYETEDTFLESPVWTDSLLLQPSLKQQIASSLENEILPTRGEAQAFIGRQIGVYRLTAEIGKGGMGVVYSAERADGEFYQKVAIKLIKRGMDTDFIVKRFRHERQIAATLNHPNIARLLDGGTTSDSLPYFVMEFIEGEPLYRFCEKNRLGIPKRLKLFGQICAAVSYAHGKQIVHRDIKPGNILISDEGMPKLLDFGIAKILDPNLIHESLMQTATQMRLMTPEYASPEQVRGETISPASDQYSLGVLLYELVTGVRPYTFPSRAPHEIARVICEEEPSRPSARCSSLVNQQKEASHNRQKNNGQKTSNDERIDESLEKIILKSLRKNPSERYASVAEFAGDIERYLTRQPIRAESFSTGKELFSRQTAQKSIAVLPLKIINTSAAEDETGDAFLSVGLADALITRLSNVRQFVVRPTSSILRYGEGATDSFAAGEELNVSFVLDGNIIKTDNQIRVSVQLLNVAEQSTVWAERFDEDLIDVLSLEDVISAKVAESLVPRLTTGERKNLAKRGTDNAEAYEAYLRGRFYWNTFTEEGFRQAIFYYQKAVELDSTYALAYAGIADYYIWLGIYGVLSPTQTYQPAKEMAQLAIEYDATLAEAYAALGFAQLCGDFDWRTSEKNIRRAVELSPNYAVAHNWLAIYLFTAGRFDEGIRYAQKAVELDPLTYQNHRTLSWGFYFSQRFDECVTEVDLTIEKFPMFGVAYFNRSWVLRFTGETEEALQSSEKALEAARESVFVLIGHAQALAAAGKIQEAEKTIEQAKSQTRTGYISYYHVALVYCYTKEKEKALDALERASSDGDGWLVWLAVEPALDVLRGEPRFVEILKRVQPPKTKLKFVPDTLLQNVVTAPEAEIAVESERPKRRLSAPLKYALAAIILTFAAFGSYHIISHSTVTFDSNGISSGESWRSSFSSKMSIKRLTTSGTAIMSAISPDGKQVAFSLREAELQGLWVQPVDSGNAVQLVAPGIENYVGLTFSPDGKFIYYDTYNPTDASWWLNRVASTGGAPQKILKGVYKNIGFASDGKQITYFSIDEKKQAINLLITEISEDGTTQPPKTLATRVLPNHFVGNPAFSPDAKKIVYAATDVSEEMEITNLFSFNLDTGTEEKIGSQNFNEITAIAWRENEGEIVISANEKNTEPLQLWLVAYPSGGTSRLTNDLNNYSGVSLTKKSTALVTAKKNINSNISVIDLNAAKPIDDTSAKPIIGGVDRQDGIKGINWTADGRIIYVANTGVEKTVGVMNADGGGSRVFDIGDAIPANPIMTGDGRYLFFVDEKERESVIKRYELATGALAQITSALALAPVLTADNQFLIYPALNDTNKTSLHRISIDGGKAAELTSASAYRPAISPDGRFIACFFNSDLFSGRWEIAILNISGGIPVNVINPPGLANLQNPHERRLAWSPDSRSIFYVNDKGGVSNIFRVAVAGNQPPEKITNFAAGRIFEFALTPDGKRAALARGSTSSDIVIFRDSK